jgi:hypothetical protein
MFLLQHLFTIVSFLGKYYQLYILVEQQLDHNKHELTGKYYFKVA